MNNVVRTRGGVIVDIIRYGQGQALVRPRHARNAGAWWAPLDWLYIGDYTRPALPTKARGRALKAPARAALS